MPCALCTCRESTGQRWQGAAHVPPRGYAQVKSTSFAPTPRSTCLFRLTLPNPLRAALSTGSAPQTLPPAPRRAPGTLTHERIARKRVRNPDHHHHHHPAMRSTPLQDQRRPLRPARGRRRVRPLAAWLRQAGRRAPQHAEQEVRGLAAADTGKPAGGWCMPIIKPIRCFHYPTVLEVELC